MCHSDAVLLCILVDSSAPARGAPHLPQNCSSTNKLLPHFQHGNSRAEPALALTLVPDALGERPSVTVARFGWSLSMAASIVDRSTAMEFFKLSSASRQIASVTSPAISWQVWMSCSAKP